MTSLIKWLRQRHTGTAEKPLRDELLSIERLEERALALAARFTIDPDPRRRARDTRPRFEDNVAVLRAAYRTLGDDVRRGLFVSSAADWLLDNFHLVTAEILDIRRNLPRTYSRTLPALASREHAGHARIYAIAVELIRHSDGRLDRQQLIQFLNSYQRVAVTNTTAWETEMAVMRDRLVRELLELIDAIDRRVPHVEREGEIEIARDAEALKAKAVKRIAELERGRVTVGSR